MDSHDQSGNSMLDDIWTVRDILGYTGYVGCIYLSLSIYLSISFSLHTTGDIRDIWTSTMSFPSGMITLQMHHSHLAASEDGTQHGHLERFATFSQGLQPQNTIIGFRYFSPACKLLPHRKVSLGCNVSGQFGLASWICLKIACP